METTPENERSLIPPPNQEPSLSNKEEIQPLNCTVYHINAEGEELNHSFIYVQHIREDKSDNQALILLNFLHSKIAYAKR